jgi:WD40 repeat protein
MEIDTGWAEKMTRDEALQVLGLSDADPRGIPPAFEARAADLAARIAGTPTPALREEYQQQTERLRQARDWLLGNVQPRSDPDPLTLTKQLDLPVRGPVATDDLTVGGPVATNSGRLLPGGPEARGVDLGLAPGKLLADRYEIRLHLGSGGMGQVFAALDRVRGEEVAIKILHPHLLDDPKARERFLDEARIASKLAHPNIVRVFDVHQVERFTFLTMELLKGHSLREEIERRKRADERFKIQEILAIADPLCESLQYAHGQTVHRDVKPENIWICDDGTTKLLDFGIARLLRPSQFTSTGLALGTAYYMAPEQLRGLEIDHRADQFAVGVVLYELLTGEIPQGVIQAPHKLRPSVPIGLSQAVMTALAGQPQKRHLNMKVMQGALRGSRISRRTLFQCSAVAGLLVLAILVAIAFTRKTTPGPGRSSSLADTGDERSASPVELQIAQHEAGATGVATNANHGEPPRTRKELQDRADRLWVLAREKVAGGKFADSLALLRRIETLTPDDPRIESLQKLAATKVHAFSGNTSTVANIAVTSDGRQVLSASLDGMHIWDLETGRKLRRFGEEYEQFGSRYPIALSNDGRYALGGGIDVNNARMNGKDLSYDLRQNIRLWEVGTGREVSQLAGHKNDIDSVAFSPDARRAISCSSDAMCLWDVETGREIRRFNRAGSFVGFSGNRPWAISHGENGKAWLWDLDSGEEIRTFLEMGPVSQPIRISTDSHVLATIDTKDGLAIHLWDISTGREARKLTGHTGPINDMEFLPKGRILASASDDHSVRLWNTETGAEIGRFEGHLSEVTGVAYTGDGRWVVSCGLDESIRVFDSGTLAERTRIGGDRFNCQSNAMRFTNGDGELVTCQGSRQCGDSTPGKVRFWDLNSGLEKSRTESLISQQPCLAISADGGRALSEDCEGAAVFWDTQDGRELMRMSLPKGWECMHLSADARRVLVTYHDHLMLLDTQTGKAIKENIGCGPILSGRGRAISGDGRLSLISRYREPIGSEFYLELWDLESGQLLKRLIDTDLSVDTCAFSADSRRAIVGRCEDSNIVQLWDLESGKELRRFKGHSKKIKAVALSADGRFGLSASEDSTVRLWDLNSGSEARSYRVPKHNEISAISLSADGEMAAASSGGTIYVWTTKGYGNEEFRRFESRLWPVEDARE